MNDESLEFRAEDGVRLRGTVARPAASDPPPAALLLNGSGPLDRGWTAARARR